MKKIYKIFIAIVVLLLSTVFLLYIAFAAAAVSASGENTEQEDYEQTLKNYGYPNDVLQHFPDSIPENAVNVEFRESPSFLQKGSYIYLICEYDENNFNDVAENMLQDMTAEKISVQQNEISDSVSLVLKGDYYLPTRFQDFCKNVRGENDIWDYYICCNRSSDEPEWNHGLVSGSIMNADAGLIIYYYEAW